MIRVPSSLCPLRSCSRASASIAGMWLLAQVAEVEGQIASMTGGKLTGSSGRRPRNNTNLAEALHGVLKGKRRGVSEAAQAVLDSGYRTTAGNFRTIVNQRLINDKRFKKVERGVYTA